MFVLVIIGYIFWAIFELIPLYKKKTQKDFWVSVTLGIFSFTIAILLCLDVKIPSPEKPIRELITSIFGK